MKLAEIAQSFWARVKKTDSGCWKWQGYTTKDGYGMLQVRRLSRAPLYAHRIAWELTNDIIPIGMDVLHSCDNPPCCNPDHLFLGTQKDNNDDRDNKKRTASGDSNGARTHPERNPFVKNHGSGLSGTNHPMSKLSDRQIKQIITEYPSYVNKTVLAKQFNISLTHLQRIAKKYNIYNTLTT